MFSRRRRSSSAQLPVKDGATIHATGRDRAHTSHLIARAALEAIRI